jgi:hypothetical protein
VVIVDDDTDNGSHGNTSVLALDSSATLEGLGLGLDPAKGIIDTKRLSDSERAFSENNVNYLFIQK